MAYGEAGWTVDEAACYSKGLDAPELVRVPKELFPKPRINCHEFLLPRVSLQDRTDILSVLANDIFSWTSLDKQEEARIPETS